MQFFLRSLNTEMDEFADQLHRKTLNLYKCRSAKSYTKTNWVPFKKSICNLQFEPLTLADIRWWSLYIFISLEFSLSASPLPVKNG